MTWRQRGLRILLAAALALVAWRLPAARRVFLGHVVADAGERGPAPVLPAAAAAATVLPAPFVRVVLVDGAGAETAATMPAWSSLCARGFDLVVDVGFPTVSLPVEVALWSGRTQQQTGVVFHSGKALAPRLTAPAIPPQIHGSHAVAESHSYIVQSLGFAIAEPPLAKDVPPGWAESWIGRARAAVAGPSRLAFVHILRVDTVGHKSGRDSTAYREAAADADAILGDLIDAGDRAHPGTRWLVIADHGHLDSGGHGGEERSVRQVRGCLAGAGLEPLRGGPVHIADIARALADSLGVALAPDAIGRPLRGAIAAPLSGDEALPSLPLGRGALAVLVIALAIALTGWGMRGAWSLGPWWFPVALAALILLARSPSLSTPMVYRGPGRELLAAFWPGLIVLALSAGHAIRVTCPARVVAALLAAPLGALAAALTACGAWPLVTGASLAPIVPTWTAWVSPLFLILATAAAVVALALTLAALIPGLGPPGPASQAVVAAGSPVARASAAPPDSDRR